jgi:hypothetical protein
MPRIELNYLLAQSNTTPEQQIFLTWFYSFFDSNAAAHRQIVNVEPIFYNDVIAASEFLTYAATKLYIALELEFVSVGVNLGQAYITLNNQNNALEYYMNNNSVYWDATAAAFKCYGNNVSTKNIYFSRIAVAANYYQMKIVGYRITLN